MSKRDDDSQADMEVGMTTAERRRRRRRGGGLRVPSDNVPRRTTPPVVPPVPEDPSLAMSIAYSFSSEASEPVPRVALDTPSAQARAASATGGGGADPIAPDAMATVIDPPTANVDGGQDFEMKTREMSAVDLEALGLSESSITTTDPGLPGIGLDIRFKRREDTRPSDIEIDVQGLDVDLAAPSIEIVETVETVEPDAGESGSAVPAPIAIEASSDAMQAADVAPPVVAPVPVRPVRERKERLKTVALTEEDLEEVREAVRAATAPSAAAPSGPSGPAAPLAAPVPTPPPPPMPAPPSTPVTSRTMPLTPLDIEVEKVDEPSAILGSGEIDIQELSERSAESSGEIEVDVDDEPRSGPLAVATVVAAPVVVTSVPAPTQVAAQSQSQPVVVHPPVAEAKRPRPPSTPPPIAPAAAQTAAQPGTHSPPPVPPPAQHKAPPTPPPAPTKREPTAKEPAAKSPSVGRTTTNDGKLSPRSAKQWFVDLFDEDYLRTLPFLTPQATQAEAEFVIDAMGLTAGAQVLDVGCGYGRHAMELAARGFHVVGLDLSTPLLVRGGEEAHRRGLQINFVRGDMRELDFEAQFDGAYCLFSTFGYFDDETNKRTVSNIARALKPGGRVMIEILNRDYLITDLPTRVWWEGDGCVVLEEVELNYFSSRIQVNRSVVFDDGRQLEQEISVRAYSLHEVGKLMHAAGFRVLEVSGGYHTRGRFFGNQSRHIIVLAERKEVTPGSSG